MRDALDSLGDPMPTQFVRIQGAHNYPVGRDVRYGPFYSAGEYHQFLRGGASPPADDGTHNFEVDRRVIGRVSMDT